MSLKSGQAISVLFSTANATTGAATDATGTPAGTLYVNGTANGATVTVTNLTTGLYKAAVTLPALAAGDVVSLRVAATVGTVAGEGVVWQEVADTERVSDLNDLSSAGAQTAAAAALAAYDAATGTDVSGLSTLTAQNVWEYAARTLTSGGGVTAQQVWEYASRTLTSGAAPSAGSIADAVWDELLAGHAAAGSAGAGVTAAQNAGDPWAAVLPGGYDSTQAGAILPWIKAQLASTVIQAAELAAASGVIAIHRGDTWTATVTGLGGLIGREKLWFTVKARASQADADALIQIEESAGLLRLSGGGAVGTGTLTVTNAEAGNVTIALSAAATAMLPVGSGYLYDFQMLDGTTVRTVGVGTAAVSADVTRATG